MQSLQTNLMAYQRNEAFRDFNSMKQLGLFLFSLDGMLVHHRVTPSIRFAGTHLYTWVKRSLAKNTTQCPTKTQTRTAGTGVQRTSYQGRSTIRLLSNFFTEQIIKIVEWAK